jgi:hypothetical protein
VVADYRALGRRVASDRLEDALARHFGGRGADLDENDEIGGRDSEAR